MRDSSTSSPSSSSSCTESDSDDDDDDEEDEAETAAKIKPCNPVPKASARPANKTQGSKRKANQINSDTEDENHHLAEALKCTTRKKMHDVKPIKSSPAKKGKPGSAHALLQHVRLATTGARVGDQLEGTDPVTKGALLLVCTAPVPPYQRDLDQIRADPDLWHAFLRHLGSISFFASMTEEDRAAWLQNNQTSNGRIGYDREEGYEAMRIQVLGLGSSVLSKDTISAEHVAELTSANEDGSLREWRAQEIENMIPAPNGQPISESGRHTLFFIKAWWKISTDCEVLSADVPDTVTVIDVELGRITKGAFIAAGAQLLRVEHLKTTEGSGVVVFRVPTGAPVKTGLMDLLESHLVDLWLEISGRTQGDDLKDTMLFRAQVAFCYRELRHHSPSALKSLLQKLIRFPSRLITSFFFAEHRLQEQVNGALAVGEEEVKLPSISSTSAGGESQVFEALDSRLVLLVTCCLLLDKGLSFNPDIGRQVSGMESFLKRLAVILFEDASFTDGGAAALSLLSGALLAQRLRTWRPTHALLGQWLRVALKAWATPRCFRYDTAVGAKLKPYSIDSTSTPTQVCSSLLDSLQSFAGDLSMVRHIASKPDSSVLLFSAVAAPVANITEPVWHGIERMPIYHAVDQHHAPNIGYFFPVKLVSDFAKSALPGKPFSTLFRRLFDQVTGMNPRRRVINEKAFEADAFVRHARAAQCQTYWAKHLDQDIPRQVDMQKEGLAYQYDFEFSLDSAWIAGLVGSIELKARPANAKQKKEKRPALLVTLCCDAPTELVVTRKPARGLTEEDARISATIEQEASNEARALLSRGVQMVATTAPTDRFKKCRAVWDKEVNDYWIESATAPRQLWENARHLKLSVPLHSPLFRKDGVFSMSTALSTHGAGIQVGAFESLKDFVDDNDRSPQAVLNRVMHYLDTNGTTIALHKIARDGDGVHRTVNAIDTAVYAWLLEFSVLFPGALRPAAHRLNTFVVPNGPLLWHVRAHLREIIREKRIRAQAGAGLGSAAVATASSVPKAWNLDQLRPNHVPWLHQTDAVADMVRKHDAGRRGHYLHAPVGTGKTLIVNLYLKHLAGQPDQLPPHIVYTLPREAITSIVGELVKFGWRVHLLVTDEQRTKEERKRQDAREAQRRIAAGRADVKPVACLPDVVRLQTDWSALVPFVVTLVEHDSMRKIGDMLRASCDDLILINDEAHKTLNDTQRTTVVLEVASQARGGFVALSGTPVVDSRIFKLVPWLSLICPFGVNLENFWAAANSLVAQSVDTGVRVHVREIEAPWGSASEEQNYRKLVPAKLGGSNTYVTREDMKQALALCYTVCTREMVRLAYDVLYDQLHFGQPAWCGGIFIVADDAAHQQRLKDMLTIQHGSHPTLSADDIFCLGPDGALHISDEDVENRTVRDFPVVITTKRMCSGYTATRLKASISSVYPSNLATRLQLSGRLNRLSQRAKNLDSFVVHKGLLTQMLLYHGEAASIDAALKSMGVLVAIHDRE